MLTPAERSVLLRIARAAIEAHLGVGGPPEPPTSAALERHAGCFVTLRVHGELRGCIGTFAEDKPLWRVVAEMAVAAASQDPRFPPLAAAELPAVRIEISVLTPRRRVASVRDIEVGRHGLWVERGLHRGVLLPQVASEEGWDAQTFLEHTCRKAGLPAIAARDPETAIYVFEAEVFGEG